MYALVKRVLDICFAGVSLVILFPLFAVLSLLVALLDGRPIFFRQERPGLQGKSFVLVKFRTMSNSRGEETADERLRVTRLGAILRKTSLDELPSLWNVVRGDLSFVGPRPLLIDYLPLYSERHRARHNVSPGLTGLAQVAGRNHLSWKERLDLDVFYAENRSLLLDLKILWRTVFIVAAA